MASLSEWDKELLSNEWARLQSTLTPPVRRSLSALVADKAPELVENFYSELGKDPDARDFLSQDLVADRLAGALRRWLTGLFPADAAPDFQQMAEVQLHVGAVHSRIGLPLKLVTRALRLMIDGLIAAAAGRYSDADQSAMLRAAVATLSIAIDIMNTAYVEKSRQNDRSAEAFRLFSLGKNMSQEREAQRAAMAEWLQEAMYVIATGDQLDRLSDMRSSEFGLWLSHRGDVIFEGTHEIERARRVMERIDAEILPAIRRGGDLRLLLQRLNDEAARIRALVAECFSAAARIEGGHDALTGVLSRRFMDTILTREVETARKRRHKFSVALVDIDHFKAVNDRYGHAVGDLALRHCVQVIAESARVGDFVFRYGGEEFLVTLAEMDLIEARSFGEQLLAALRNRPLHLEDGTSIIMTASIGVAEFSGEPDFLRLTEAADRALYEAKHLGRSQVRAAE
ncbi:GGDEF domain-containing protein [Pseudogemmobacter faecipullorum]|uniref:Diguanylate cyclase DosC n=1 Tax=Pseudogemmobacter faecipullorum TaxID=2755041 RepID=A0ABS8CPC9_9RHOB|nr:GGDEF domain-containing protein [Pseudogemmobacter faecipullorum]MCB5411234.1 GGDEF domain-containing protein [Pseudogemmobacter faecipullorum]